MCPRCLRRAPDDSRRPDRAPQVMRALRAPRLRSATASVGLVPLSSHSPPQRLSRGPFAPSARRWSPRCEGQGCRRVTQVMKPQALHPTCWVAGSHTRPRTLLRPTYPPSRAGKNKPLRPPPGSASRDPRAPTRGPSAARRRAGRVGSEVRGKNLPSRQASAASVARSTRSSLAHGRRRKNVDSPRNTHRQALAHLEAHTEERAA